MQQHSTAYTIGFSAAVCIVCSLLVSATAVGLKERQDENAKLDMQKNVLMAAGLLKPKQSVSREEITKRFEEGVESVFVDMKKGEEAPRYSEEMAAKDTEGTHSKIYKVVEENTIKTVILPIEGKGLWSTLYGFLALDADGNTVRGITFYKHGETPGLGGEIDNPTWKEKWLERKVFDEAGKVKISVIKGNAGKPGEDPYNVDGLSGATLTARGVDALVKDCMGENGFGPYLKKLRAAKSEKG